MADHPTTPPSKLYDGCIECKKKRTLCIHVRRAGTWDFGHVNLSLQEDLSNASTKPTTYGNWPGGDGQSIRKNDPGDDPTKDSRYHPEDVKCKELDAAQEQKLKDRLAQPQTYSLTNNNCAGWAGSTWNSVTGDNLNYGADTNYLYNSPTTVGQSIHGQ